MSIRKNMLFKKNVLKCRFTPSFKIALNQDPGLCGPAVTGTNTLWHLGASLSALAQDHAGI